MRKTPAHGRPDGGDLVTYRGGDFYRYSDDSVSCADPAVTYEPLTGPVAPVAVAPASLVHFSAIDGAADSGAAAQGTVSASKKKARRPLSVAARARHKRHRRVA